MVYICQVPWAEMNVNNELSLFCESDLGKSIEIELRRTLYAWRRFRVDMVVEPVIRCPLETKDSGFGIQQSGRKETFYESSIVAQSFLPQIKNEQDLEKIKDPKVEVDWESTKKKAEVLEEVFQGILPVKVSGIRGIWFAPWDELVRWYGVQEVLQDLVLRPDLVHAAIDRLVCACLARLNQYEKLGLLESNNGAVRVGSGGLGFTTGLPHAGNLGIQPSEMWGCAAAQIFAGISPEMHEEFALTYELRWLERFGLNYYGCCEPLHHKLHVLRKIPRLRKVSFSPQAEISRAIEQGAGIDFVLSVKPNPAIFAGTYWDIEEARRQLKGILVKTKGCAVEIIMKDISTVRFEPKRLWDWARMAMELVDRG